MDIIHRAKNQLPAGPGRAVEAGPGYRQGLWQSFGVHDGLVGSSITALLQDRAGHLWVGTWDQGAIRYDGECFTTFTMADGLAGNRVGSIVEDREGHLWFGTEGGVSRYDGEEFVNLTNADGLVHSDVRCVLEDRRGDLWFGTEGGASRYDGEEFVNFTSADGLAHNWIRSILEDRGGNLWFIAEEVRPFAWGGSICRYDGNSFTPFSLEGGPADKGAYCLLEDREGRLWIGSFGGGLYQWDGEVFTHRDGLMSDRVRCLAEDAEGHLWIGAIGGGVARYDGKEFTFFTVEEGLANNSVTALLEDRENNLWVGTIGGELSRYDKGQFASFNTRDGLVNDGVMDLVEDGEGGLWIGTWGGVCQWDREHFTALEALRGKNVWSLVRDRKGRLWIGTPMEGVWRYDGEQIIHFAVADGLVSDRVTCLLEDQEGQLWIGTWGGGASRWDGEGFVNFTTKDGLADDAVCSLLEERNGYLWIGTEGGLSRWDGESFVNLTVTDGLAANRVDSLLEDRDGQLWIGTWGGGLSRWDGEKFINYTIGDGLAHNRVRSLLEDREGRLWIGTWGGGVSRYDGTLFQTLSRRDGLSHDMVQQILQDRKGDIWIATEGGITRYRPARTPPSIRIRDVVTDQRHGPIAQFQVPVSQKLLAFEFQGKSLTTRLDGMAYLYRLKGRDPDWRVAYGRRVEYPDLSLGEYTFQVWAVDRDLNYSEPAEVQVSVVPDPRLEALTQALSASGGTGEFVGASPALRRVQEQLAEVAKTDLTVLVLGETGTGKGLAARTVHGLSPRRRGPFIQVSCGAIPEGLIESELFGHERGAFTGAVSRKLGKVELAQGGTLFLDEIGDMALEAQTRLLRLLEERCFERVGGTETLEADVRVIAATNRELRQQVARGQFREDLYFRLNGFPVRLPALRERQEDIPLLAFYFMERMAAHLSKEVHRLTPEALRRLQEHDWPGNVRELEHVVQRAVIVCRGPAIRGEDLALETEAREEIEEVLALEEVERRHVLAALEKAGWIIKGLQGAAALLGLPPSTLRSRMKRLGIARP